MWGHVENDQDDYFDKDDCVHKIEHPEGDRASDWTSSVVDGGRW